MAETVRLVVVGAGRIAADHLKVLRSMPDVQVVGVTSRTRAKAQSLAAQFDIPLVVDDIVSLMEGSHPDGLLILVSADQVYEVTCAALNFGVPLFIEKPPGLFPAETWKLAYLARTQGVRTMVGYNRRYYSVFRKGIQIIQQHGSLVGILVEGHERMAKIRAAGFHPEHVFSAWLYVNATHTIDLLRFFGGEVQEVYSIAHRYREAGGDQFAAVMNFASGTMGTYVSHWLSPGGWRVVLYGQGVTVEFKPLESGSWTDVTFQSHEIEPEPEDLQYRPGFYQQMLAFSNLVRSRALEWPGQDLEGAYRTMRLAEQLAAPLEDRGQ